MNIAAALNFIGTLVPVLFPDKEFKPRRLAAVVLLFTLAVGSIKLLGVEGTIEAIGVTEEFIELTEE